MELTKILVDKKLIVYEETNYIINIVIGANSFVNKDVPPYAIVFGSPAKLYKYRFPEDVKKRLNACEYWKYNPQKAKELLKSI